MTTRLIEIGALVHVRARLVDYQGHRAIVSYLQDLEHNTHRMIDPPMTEVFEPQDTTAMADSFRVLMQFLQQQKELIERQGLLHEQAVRLMESTLGIGLRSIAEVYEFGAHDGPRIAPTIDVNPPVRRLR